MPQSKVIARQLVAVPHPLWEVSAQDEGVIFREIALLDMEFRDFGAMFTTPTKFWTAVGYVFKEPISLGISGRAESFGCLDLWVEDILWMSEKNVLGFAYDTDKQPWLEEWEEWKVDKEKAEQKRVKAREYAAQRKAKLQEAKKEA